MNPHPGTQPPSEQPEPRRWALEKCLTDDQIEQGRRHVVVDYTMEKMRAEFDRVKAERGWPENARPLWTIGWEYIETPPSVET